MEFDPAWMVERPEGWNWENLNPSRRRGRGGVVVPTLSLPSLSSHSASVRAVPFTSTQNLHISSPPFPQVRPHLIPSATVTSSTIQATGTRRETSPLGSTRLFASITRLLTSHPVSPAIHPFSPLPASSLDATHTRDDTPEHVRGTHPRSKWTAFRCGTIALEQCQRHQRPVPGNALPGRREEAGGDQRDEHPENRQCQKSERPFVQYHSIGLLTTFSACPSCKLLERPRRTMPSSTSWAWCLIFGPEHRWSSTSCLNPNILMSTDK